MSSNTSGGPTRRERMRAETIGEIKASAQRQLLEHGPGGVSLRAIAREVGVSPAALYRYFDSLDSLLVELCCDFYDELIDETRRAMDAAGGEECHLDRMKAWIWSFRSWAVANRRKFELMINIPEGAAALGLSLDIRRLSWEDLPPVTRKSMEHAQQCGAELAAYYHQRNDDEALGFAALEPPELSDGLQRELREKCGALIIGEELPLTWVYSFVSGWVRVFGLVTMEAFGSLPVQENIEEFYKAQVLSMMKDFGIEP
ncbi:TetR/AcrR family transcriptional regulator [Glycomyces tenuis]|uniref:TetR/AcrR family transcriptional regulator n=1 Tax=Glycomyces tenuis TaxID=58116 RepID=UPI0003FBAAB6|nr:TetR/AcrR family transcriptional regulator [Glycomyces tenuis]